MSIARHPTYSVEVHLTFCVYSELHIINAVTLFVAQDAWIRQLCCLSVTVDLYICNLETVSDTSRLWNRTFFSVWTCSCPHLAVTAWALKSWIPCGNRPISTRWTPFPNFLDIEHGMDELAWSRGFASLCCKILLQAHLNVLNPSPCTTGISVLYCLHLLCNGTTFRARRPRLRSSQRVKR